MCGIVGFAGSRNQPVIEKMNSVQSHRGPDDAGYYFDDRYSIHLAMSRLSIVDIKDGHQPMSNHDESLYIVFNGEIFNSNELRAELLKKGYTFKTDHSDTEVLIYMYQHYGEEMLPYLNGMFAFVIYDIKASSLFAARDRFGIKPFYYSVVNDHFSFASELKSLFCCPWISKELNNQGIYDYFTVQTIPAPHSIYEDIKKLPSGHSLRYDLASKSSKINRYYSPGFSAGNRFDLGM
jgi:asparagine synthase (glutamine-hydrolysing)